MLAVMHHLVVTERIPVPNLLALASELTGRFLVIEYIDREDAMFRKITRGRDHLHADLSIESFEDACRQRFEIVRSQPNGTRRMYLLKRRGEI